MNYSISVGTSDFITNPVVVEKGVLQGVGLNPLIFNMCFNTLMRPTENEQSKLLGYNYTNALSLRHWFQFADDTALATTTQEEIQALLNVFTKRCKCVNFKICIDRCRCFGINKNGKQSTQLRPYLTVNNEMILAVKLKDSFVCLGKEFCYNMSCENVKCYLSETQRLSREN